MPLHVDSQAMILNNQLRQLAKFRGETETLFDDLISKAKEARQKAKTKEKEIIKTADTIGFAVDCIIGIGLLTRTAAKAVKLSGTLLKEANEEFVKIFAKQTGEKVVGIGGIIFDPSNKAIEVAVNLTSPSYWANRVALWGTRLAIGDPDNTFAKMIKEFENDRIKSLSMIDNDILNVSERLRYATSGIDVSSIA